MTTKLVTSDAIEHCIVAIDQLMMKHGEFLTQQEIVAIFAQFLGKSVFYVRTYEQMPMDMIDSLIAENFNMKMQLMYKDANDQKAKMN